MVKCTGSGLVAKRPGVLSKGQMLNLVLGVGVFCLLPIKIDTNHGLKNAKTDPKNDPKRVRKDLLWSAANGGLRDGGLSKSKEI